MTTAMTLLGTRTLAWTAAVSMSDMLASQWGLTLDQTLLILAALLLVVDFFFESEAMTYIGYVLICAVVFRHVDAPPLLRLTAAVATFGGLIAFHYSIWRAIGQWVANNLIAPDRYRVGAEGLVGTAGVIRDIDGTLMVEVRGDLWPYLPNDEVHADDAIVVVASQDGKLKVRKATDAEAAAKPAPPADPDEDMDNSES